jgi:hypothetical protein
MAAHAHRQATSAGRATCTRSSQLACTSRCPAGTLGAMKIFHDGTRSDRTPRHANESGFAFLDRTGSAYFEPVRDLIESWVADLPADHQAGVIGQLTSGEDAAFESAFWELYLYKVTTGGGARVELHPDVPGSAKHPDFLVRAADPYYLEAVSVGTDPKRLARQRRLAEVEAILDDARVDGLTLSAEWNVVGETPIKATKLRDKLLAWIDTVDRDQLLHLYQAGGRRHGKLLTFQFEEAGWSLTFTALPTGGRDMPLIGMRGPGRAVGVDNKTGLRRALDSKASRYGTELPYPLVTAVLSNTEYPTRDYDIQPVLYGEHALPPNQVTDPTELYADGHWRTTRGWQRSHNPNVVTATNLSWHSMGSVVPRLWNTVEPGVHSIGPLSWADTVDVSGHEASAPIATAALSSLGITEAWCTGGADFD